MRANYVDISKTRSDVDRSDTVSNDRNKTLPPRIADDTAPILVPYGVGIWTFGDHLRHLAGHAGTIPLALDEFGRCVICLRRGFFSRTRNRWCEAIQGRKAWRDAGVIRPGRIGPIPP